MPFEAWFILPSRDGNTVLLFNPETGTEDIEFQLTGSDLENIRGHWAAVKLSVLNWVD